MDDGTFQAESWPDVLNCTGETPFELGELADSPLVDVTGTWTFDEGDPTVNGGYFIPATLNLHFDEGCDDPSALAGAYFTRDIQGTVTMCFSNTDPDNFGPRTSYAMLKGPSPGNATRQACTP